MKIRVAQSKDFAEIRALVEKYAEQGLLLPRGADDIQRHLDRFLVLTEVSRSGGDRQERLAGCVSLEPYGEDLAEVRSLAVAPSAQGRGAGARLVDAALEMAKERGIARVFAVTHAPALFERRGFQREASRHSVTEKVERDCRFCSRANDCDLVALTAVVCPERELLPILSGYSSKAGIRL